MSAPPILRATNWATNAALIADVARLGYIKPTDRVLDPTFGKGNWWNDYDHPGPFVAHDLYKLDGIDFRALPEADGSVDVVAFDPPYVGQGGVETSTVPGFQDAYGIAEKSKGHEAVLDLICGGISEAARVLVPGGILLVKCMNYVVGGKYRSVAYDALAHARSVGFTLIDEMVHVRSPGPQPERDCQHHARANLSLLFVLRANAQAKPASLFDVESARVMVDLELPEC